MLHAVRFYAHQILFTYNVVACDFRKDRLFLQVCIESPVVVAAAVVVVVSPSLV